MLIICGKRRTERKLGFVADFCPVCHEPRAFQLVRVGIVTHLYYISFGSGHLVGHLIRCEECQTDLESDPTRYAAVESLRSPDDLSELILKTFPALQATYGAQMAREAEIRRNPRSVSATERQTMLLAPFQLLTDSVEARFANSAKMDKPAGIGCLATILITFGILFAAIELQGPLSDSVVILLACVAGLGGLYTFVQIHLAPGRFLRSRTIPQLARALGPFQPDDEELQSCLKSCRDVGWLIGSKIKPKAILAEIGRQQSSIRPGF